MPTALLVWAEAALSMAEVELRAETEVACGAVSVTVVVTEMEGRSDLELLEAVSGVLALALVGSRDASEERTGWFDSLVAGIRSELDLGEAVS